MGLFVPLLPTTDFMLLAVPCFARSSPQLEAWLLNHKRFGAPIRAWRAERAIPKYAKVLACVGMAVGYGWFFVSVRPSWPSASGVAIIMIGTAIWLVRRPRPSNISGLDPRDAPSLQLGDDLVGDVLVQVGPVLGDPGGDA